MRPVPSTSNQTRKAKKTERIEIDPTEKQILRSVQYGRKCTFHLFDCEPVTGYVAGVGMYRYMVIFPEDGEIQKVLIHKGSSPKIDLHEEPAFDAEPQDVQEALLAILGPFRRWVNDQLHGRSSND